MHLVPVIAHDADEKEACSLERWIARAASLDKGVKLDFKDPLALLPAFECVKARVSGENWDVLWINADVVSGPRGAAPRFSEDDLDVLILKSKEMFPECVLSLGWTTGPWILGVGGKGYSDKHVDAMIGILDSYALDTAQLTFPVRGKDAVVSGASLKRLLETYSQSSLTVWVGAEGLSLKEAQSILDTFGRDRVFLDVPGLDVTKLFSSKGSVQ